MSGQARFVTSAARIEQLPQLGLPEIGFIGRSNVGKSTLIGAVLGAAKLVRTSRTPGRTRTLNLFTLDARLLLVDLPGYGYAKVSKADRGALGEMVKSYIERRIDLCGLVLVIDARREPVSEYDVWMAQWLGSLGRPALIAVTKIDQVPKNRRLGRVRAIERELGVGVGTALGCSGEGGEGIEELRRELWALTKAARGKA